MTVSTRRQGVAGGGRRAADEALALALAAGATVADSASRADLGERTAYRRLADPAFRRRVQELRAAMIDRALGRLADGMVEAAETMRALLQAQSEAVRLQAARSLLEAGCKLREQVELESRLAVLEERTSTAHSLPECPRSDPWLNSDES